MFKKLDFLVHIQRNNIHYADSFYFKFYFQVTQIQNKQKNAVIMVYKYLYFMQRLLWKKSCSVEFSFSFALFHFKERFSVYFMFIHWNLSLCVKIERTIYSLNIKLKSIKCKCVYWRNEWKWNKTENHSSTTINEKKMRIFMLPKPIFPSSHEWTHV